MTDNAIREALLKREPSDGSTIQSLNDMFAAEQRRVRRLTICTITVWVVWVLALVVGFGLPVLVRPAQPSAPPSAISTTKAAPGPSPATPTHTGGAIAAIGVAIGIILMIGLPILGIVLLVVLLATSRAANTKQMRANIARIEQQIAAIARSQASSTAERPR
jgi:hypothetical protein